MRSGEDNRKDQEVFKTCRQSGVGTKEQIKRKKRSSIKGNHR